MNAAIRSVTRTALCKGIKVKGIYRGYDGLINGDVKEFTTESVSNIIGRGGTILKSARSKEFMTREGREKAYQTMQREGIDALVVIGGNGSLTGAKTFGDEFNITLKPFNDSRVNFEQMSRADMAAIEKLYSEFEKRLPKTLQFKLNCGKRIGTYNISRLWDITDRSDAIFLKYLCDNPSEAQEAIEDHISSCVISGRKDSIDE